MKWAKRAGVQINGEVQAKKNIAICLTIAFGVYHLPAVLPLFADWERGIGYV